MKMAGSRWKRRGGQKSKDGGDYLNDDARVTQMGIPKRDRNVMVAIIK